MLITSYHENVHNYYVLSYLPGPHQAVSAVRTGALTVPNRVLADQAFLEGHSVRVQPGLEVLQCTSEQVVATGVQAAGVNELKRCSAGHGRSKWRCEGWRRTLSCKRR